MPLPKRSEIRPGQHVLISEGPCRPSDTLTEGVVLRILSRTQTHPQGIQVLLADGRTGRVQVILNAAPVRPGRAG